MNGCWVSVQPYETITERRERAWGEGTDRGKEREREREREGGRECMEVGKGKEARQYGERKGGREEG